MKRDEESINFPFTVLHVGHNKLELTLMYVVRLLFDSASLWYLKVFRRIGTTCGVVTTVENLGFSVLSGLWRVDAKAEGEELGIGGWLPQVDVSGASRSTSPLGLP